MDNRVVKEAASSTGGTIQFFKWGLRHTAGRSYGGEANTEVPEVVADKPRRGRGRPRKNG